MAQENSQRLVAADISKWFVFINTTRCLLKHHQLYYVHCLPENTTVLHFISWHFSKFPAFIFLSLVYMSTLSNNTNNIVYGENEAHTVGCSLHEAGKFKAIINALRYVSHIIK